MAEDEMVGWYHQLSGHEFERALGDCDRQGSLVCCSPCRWKESDMTERQNSHNNSNIKNLNYSYRKSNYKKYTLWHYLY